MTPEGRVRLEDVARRAGVSKSVASRILNGSPSLKVRPETRARVLAAAKALDYRPHAIARGLRSARTGAVGIVTPNLGMPVYAQIVRGAVRRARELEMAVLLSEDETDAEMADLIANVVEAGRIDGLIIASGREGHPLVAALEERPLPHVFVNRAVTGSGRNVTMDDARAVELTVQRLARLGHTRIGMVAGPPGIDTSVRCVRGFKDAGDRLGVETVVVEGGFAEFGDTALSHGLLTRTPRPTAIIGLRFDQAVGALHAAWLLGMDVPGAVSVVSLDDTPLALSLCPPLAAVSMPLGELGAASVDLLVEQLAGGPLRDLVVPTQARLISRGSIGPAPAL